MYLEYIAKDGSRRPDWWYEIVTETSDIDRRNSSIVCYICATIYNFQFLTVLNLPDVSKWVKSPSEYKIFKWVKSPSA